MPLGLFGANRAADCDKEIATESRAVARFREASRTRTPDSPLPGEGRESRKCPGQTENGICGRLPERGLSGPQTAKKLRRTPEAVAQKTMTLGTRFRSKSLASGLELCGEADAAALGTGSSIATRMEQRTRVRARHHTLARSPRRYRSGQITRSWHLDELRQGETSFESAISLLG